MANPIPIHTKVHEIVARTANLPIDQIFGGMSFTKPPLVFSRPTFMAMTPALNREILRNRAITNPTGPNGPSMELTAMDKLFAKTVKDLGDAMLKLANAVEKANPPPPPKKAAVKKIS